MLERLPVVTKNILIINVLLFLACQVMPPQLDASLSAYYFQNANFRPWQVITHMFMHGNMMHIFFNMFGVYMFGSVLEQYWGPKRFLNYYLLCGLGAFALHQFIAYIEVQQLVSQVVETSRVSMSIDEVKGIYQSGKALRTDLPDIGYDLSIVSRLNSLWYSSLVGASGCLFGLLLAYGVMFPNAELMLMFIPVPIKAKWFVLGYGAIELIMAFRNSPTDNVAHFAHLGGMIFGYIIIKYWQKKGKLYSN